jgi:hypothetical protein
VKHRIKLTKSIEYGYKIYVVKGGGQGQLVGTVRRSPFFNRWFAFEWKGSLTYVKGARTRKRAVLALLVLLGLEGVRSDG